MHTILDRQMVFNYVKAYLFCLVSLMSLFIVIDLFFNLEDFTAQRRDFASAFQYIATYYGYKSFQIFDRLCEAVVLLAGMFTVAWMQRNNELLPLLSAGVSTRRVVLPVILSASAMMALVVINQEFALPAIDIFMIENRSNPEGTRETDAKGAWDTNGVHISGRAAIKKESLVVGFVAVIPAQLGRGSPTVLQAREARYIPPREGDQRSGGWLLKNTKVQGQIEWANEKNELLIPGEDGDYFLKTRDVDLDTVVRVKNWYLYLPTWRLLNELDRPTNRQEIIADLAVAFHGRVTRPFLGIILIVLGLSVILRDQNRNIFISTGMCLGLCVLFFVAIFSCQFLAKGSQEWLSPALAAWLPVIVFAPLSFVMFDAVHT